jgi:hypothetical protein
MGEPTGNVLRFTRKKAKSCQYDWCDHCARSWDVDEDTQLVTCECGYIMSAFNALMILYDAQESDELVIRWGVQSRTRYVLKRQGTREKEKQDHCETTGETKKSQVSDSMDLAEKGSTI